VFFPRQKAGDHSEPELLARHININYEALEKLFHLPLKDAAREIGLCSTTFKKACRHFNMKKWPFRKGQSKNPRGKPRVYSRRNAQTDAAITLRQETARAPAAPTLQTTEMHHDKSAVCNTVPRTASSSTGAASRTASSATTVRASSVECHILLQQASTACATAFPRETFPPLDALSYIDSLTASGHKDIDSLTSSGHKGTEIFNFEGSQEGSQGDSLTSGGSPVSEGLPSTPMLAPAIAGLNFSRATSASRPRGDLVVSSPVGDSPESSELGQPSALPCGATLPGGITSSDTDLLSSATSLARGLPGAPMDEDNNLSAVPVADAHLDAAVRSREQSCVVEGQSCVVKQQSCVEAVLEYLETSERFGSLEGKEGFGSLAIHAGNFDFMFEDDEETACEFE